MSDFDIEGARKAGYSDAEIADHLGKARGFDVAGARKSGYSDADILGHLAAPVESAARPEPRPPVAASAVYNNRPMSVAQPAPAEPAPQKPQPAALPWSDLPGNVLSSAGNFASALAQPFLHPVDTYEGLVKVAAGAVAPPSWLIQETPEEKAARTAPANALGDYFANRYGGMRNIRNTVISDPVGFLADASIPLTGPANALARAPGVAGKVGTVARLADPVTATMEGAKGMGKVAEMAASHTLGLTTGAGATSVRAAAKAGKEGGENAATFRENLRGQVPVSDVVDTAKSAVAQMRQEASDAYKARKVDLGEDTQVLDFADIDAAVDKASNVGQFKGQSGTAPAVTTEPKAAAVVEEMKGLVQAWKALDPSEYHTPVGIDALKRALGNIRDSTQPRTPDRVAADRIYTAVRNEIAAKAPGYSKMMEEYSRAADKIDETTRALSITERATGDTTARKLLSATRNNVQTNYGQRERLINALAAYEPTLPYAIAGQGLNSPMPRGLVARLGAMGAAPVNALALPAFSPRLVGEAAYLTGKGAGMADNALNLLRVNEANVRRAGRGAYQAGRAQQEAR